MTDELPVSARVAWTYLAALVATLIAAGLVVLNNQLVAPLICRDPADGAIADCKVGLGIWASLVAFLLVLIPVALKARLDLWLVATLWAEIGLWVAVDAIDRWWWWLVVLVMPAAAALASARWGSSPRVWGAQRVGIIVLLAAAIIALVWWYLNG
ncbi:MAG: hypothetical protein LWW77_09645 [Propionibacteriales bacterium]|nr:hypothetical protein [Propionibacteriales bacterium]